MQVSSQDDENKFGIGFEMYSLKGRKVESRRLPKPVITNDGGYRIRTSVSYDGSIADTGSDPLTVIMTTFKPDIEAKFRFTIHYKHAQGTVSCDKL